MCLAQFDDSPTKSLRCKFVLGRLRLAKGIMKFSKHIRLLRKPQWSVSYVDYDLLKRYIRDDRPSNGLLASAEPADCCDPGPSSTPQSLIEGLGEAQIVAAFLSALRNEVSKAQQFYTSTLEELEAKVTSATEVVGFALAKTVEEVAEGLEKGGGAAALARGQAALLELSQLIDDLREFSSLNCLAVVKITKKFDKRYGAATSAAMQEAMQTLPLANTDALSNVAERCMELMHSLPPLPSQPERPLSIVEPVAVTVESLDIASLPPSSITYLRVQLGTDPLSEPISVPVMVAKGTVTGPVVGITSAVHGNELNGIPVIHRLFRQLDCAKLCGAVIAVPVVNTLGYARYTRGYSDGVDINRVFPGKRTGTASQQFAWHFMERIVACMDYVLDLHTASFGRVNSLYVRADMNDAAASRLAKLQNPQIMVHNSNPDGSLRGAAVALGKPAVTIEIGNPQTFQDGFIDLAFTGVLNTLSHFKMINQDVVPPAKEPVVCARSFWIFTQTGGVLYVFPAVNTWVRKGETIAEIHSLFGALVDRIVAPQDAIVVGKSTNPVCQTGDRVVHLGVVETAFPAHVSDGHV